MTYSLLPCVLASTLEDQPISATLHNGISIPLIGLGCASGVRQSHVTSALNLGYRFLDTAQSFRWGYHEDEVGNALAEYSEKGEKVFVQTKIHPEGKNLHP